MKHAIIIPTGAKTFGTFHITLREYLKSAPVIISYNGCSVEEADSHSKQLKGIIDGEVLAVYAGEKANPYTARNVALYHAFKAFECEAVALADSDCVPTEGYHSTFHKYVQKGLLCAGRTKTRIPTSGKYSTRHFKWLAAKAFECYDGFTPPDFTVGSNMMIGRNVYEKLGPMRDTVVSGGDGEYGERMRSTGGVVTVASDSLVYKTIYGMDMFGICDKQIRRAKCVAGEYRFNEAETLKGLRDCLLEHAAMLEGKTSLAELEPIYDQFTDKLFQVMMYYGHMSNHTDAK